MKKKKKKKKKKVLKPYIIELRNGSFLLMAPGAAAENRLPAKRRTSVHRAKEIRRTRPAGENSTVGMVGNIFPPLDAPPSAAKESEVDESRLMT
jgi:hypothetical protein